jgi:hypothetical protein
MTSLTLLSIIGCTDWDVLVKNISEKLDQGTEMKISRQPEAKAPNSSFRKMDEEEDISVDRSIEQGEIILDLSASKNTQDHDEESLSDVKSNLPSQIN